MLSSAERQVLVGKARTEWPNVQTRECSACNYETECSPYLRAPVWEHSWIRGELIEDYDEGDYPWKWLCDLCAGTMTGQQQDYLHRNDGQIQEVLEAVCYVGNAILDAIKELKNGKDQP